jgi:hypothetical protein
VCRIHEEIILQVMALHFDIAELGWSSKIHFYSQVRLYLDRSLDVVFFLQKH